MLLCTRSILTGFLDCEGPSSPIKQRSAPLQFHLFKFVVHVLSFWPQSLHSPFRYLACAFALDIAPIMSTVKVPPPKSYAVYVLGITGVTHPLTPTRFVLFETDSSV